MDDSYNIEPLAQTLPSAPSKLKMDIEKRKKKKTLKKIKQVVNSPSFKHRYGKSMSEKPKWDEYSTLRNEASRIFIEYKNYIDAIINQMSNIKEEHKLKLQPYVTCYLNDMHTYSTKLTKFASVYGHKTGYVQEHEIMLFYSECMILDEVIVNMSATLAPIQANLITMIDTFLSEDKVSNYTGGETPYIAHVDELAIIPN